MDIASIQALSNTISSYISFVILIFGNFGCICNFITFTSKQLRKNPCGWYLLMSALFDFICINFGLSTKLANDQYGSTLKNTNLAYCRIRTYLTWILPCIATGYLLLASIDRCLSTSQSDFLRSFSQIKVAYRMTCVPIILYSLTTSHQLVYYVLQRNCAPLPGTYAYFLSVYSIVWSSLIPQIAILIFGLITYYNIKKSRRRLFNTQNQQRSQTNSQLIIITLFQVLSSSIILNIRTGYFAYTQFSENIPKDPHRLAVEAFLLNMSSYIFFINFAKSFFVSTLTSKLFRRIFRERLMSFYHRITSRNNRIHSIQTTTNRRTIQTVLTKYPIP